MQLHRARSRFEDVGARLVLIGQASPRQAGSFRRRLDIDLPVLADEERVTYRAAGAKMATIGELLGPSVVAKGVVTIARDGVIQGRRIGHPAQLGGAMIVLVDGSIAWTHMSEDASDIARPVEILAALRATASGNASVLTPGRSQRDVRARCTVNE